MKNTIESIGPFVEICSMLSCAFLRLRKRKSRDTRPEKTLDDVPGHGKVQPTEPRTLKAGEDRHA